MAAGDEERIRFGRKGAPTYGVGHYHIEGDIDHPNLGLDILHGSLSA